MARVILIVALVCFTGMVSTDQTLPTLPTYFYPIEHRGDLKAYNEAVPFQPMNYDFQIIPNDQTDVAEYDTLSFSLWDFVPNPITILTKVGSKAVSIVKYVVSKSFFVLLGIAVAIGFCAFTPYCTLTIEKPFSRELRSISENIPYMDEVENFLTSAYNKYENLQY